MIKRISNLRLIFFNADKRGFTLVEMLIALGIFTVIVTFALGAILTIFDANRKAQSSKTLIDNLNFGIENMTRTVRFGGYYYCGVSSNLTSINNCPTGDNAISLTFKGNRIVYRLNGTTIQRSDNGGSSYSNITAPEVVIEHLKFYVIGVGTLGAQALEQPYVMAVIKGYVGNKPTSQSSFSIQTLMSQRGLEL